jgi:predicted AAA+ superfamily ATPase
MGVKNSLAEMIDLSPSPQSSYFGDLFEHFFILEVFRLNSYYQRDFRMSYLRTKSGFEIDLVLSKGRKNFLIEVKSTTRIDPTEVAQLARNTEDINQISGRYYVSLDQAEIELNGVQCLSWRSFLTQMFIND